MYDKYTEVNKILKKYNQEHIINYLNGENKEKLIKQILDIDFDEILELFKETKASKEIDVNSIEPVTATNPQKISKDEILKYRDTGRNTIENGEFAVAIMAGGQGTRLRT